jgi:excisionase family DNA binding protein
MPEHALVPSARQAVNRLAYSPSEAAAAIGCTRQTIHALLNRGDLRRFKVGRLTKIPAADVHALVGYEGCDTA